MPPTAYGTFMDANTLALGGHEGEEPTMVEAMQGLTWAMHMPSMF